MPKDYIDPICYHLDFSGHAETFMHIEANEIHIFTANLETSPFQENTDLLSKDECERANCFQFPIHRQRFIAARSLLRAIVSLYIDVAPSKIIFSYDTHKKPFLENVPLAFNLSHSDHMAVYALTMHHAIGVDIEKIQPDYHEAVAERFFGLAEKNALLALPLPERPRLFYRIWARKEAIVKALGKGISHSLSSFSVSANDDFENIMIDNDAWLLLPISVDQAWQAAAATNQPVRKITYWKFENQYPVLEKEEIVENKP